MKMKKLLLGITALVGLVGASASYALNPVNKLGYIAPAQSATFVCSASRFFPGAPPGTMVKDEAVGGLQTDFLITNTSDDKRLEITKVEVYAMTTGLPIATYMRGDTVPASANAADPVFKWILAPHQTTRLSHEAVLPPNQVANPALLWNTVVFTVKAGNDSRILAPLVYSDYAEYKTPLNGGNIIDRIRTPCVAR